MAGRASSKASNKQTARKPAAKRPSAGAKRAPAGVSPKDGGIDIFSGDYDMSGGSGLASIVDFARGLGLDSLHTRIVSPRLLSDTELSALGKDGIGRRICTLPIQEALAPGYDIALAPGIDPEYAQSLLREAGEVYARLNAGTWIKRWAVTGRHYGQSILTNSFEGDRGVADLCQPPVYGRRTRWLSSWDRRDYDVAGFVASTHHAFRSSATLRLRPGRPLLEAERYRWASENGQVAVHPLRYIRAATETGYSVFQEVVVYLTNLLTAANGGASLMSRASAGVFEIEDWDAMVRARGGEAQEMLQAQFATLSSMNALFLRKGKDTFTTMDMRLSGIEQGIYAIAYLLAAALGWPMVVLLGSSPGSFSSGDSQMDLWYGFLRTVRDWLVPGLTFAWDLCFAEVLGSNRIPIYTIEWRPFEQPSPLDRLAVKRASADLAAMLTESGFLSPAAAATGLSASGGMDFDYEAAFAALADEGDGRAGRMQDPAVVSSMFTLLQAAYPNGVPRPVLRAFVRGMTPSAAAVAETLFPDMVEGRAETPASARAFVPAPV